MAETTDREPGEQDFAELLGFLQDSKLEVQRFAAEGVLEQTDSKEFLEYCRSHPRAAAKPLLRLVEGAEAEAVAESGAAESAPKEKARANAQKVATARAAGSAALQALVNLSAVPAVLNEMVQLNAPRRCAEALRAGWLEGRSEMAHWYAMLLANLTTAPAGGELLCSEEPLLRFLLAAYVAKPRPPPRGGYDDPLICLGKVLGNVCALPSGRRLLAGAEVGPVALATLLRETSERGRRQDIMGAVRNVCLDTDCHKAVTETSLVEQFATFLYPWEKVEAQQRERLPEDLRTLLAESGAALTGDVAVRNAAAVSLLGLSQSKEGLAYLREHACHELLCAWQPEEGHEETKAALEQLIPVLASAGKTEVSNDTEAKATAEQPSAAAPFDDVD